MKKSRSSKFTLLATAIISFAAGAAVCIGTALGSLSENFLLQEFSSLIMEMLFIFVIWVLLTDSCLQRRGSSGISFFRETNLPWTVRIKGRYDSECGCQRRRKYHSQGVSKCIWWSYRLLLHEQNSYSSYQRSTLPCETQEKTRQATKKTWYEPMAASSQAGTEACIFRTVQSKQCERQDQIYWRIKTNSRKKDGLKVSS